MCEREKRERLSHVKELFYTIESHCVLFHSHQWLLSCQSQRQWVDERDHTAHNGDCSNLLDVTSVRINL